MPERESAESVDCVVIGAGLSGLRCAHSLLADGHRVLVLEADEQVGGRARTVWHGDMPVDRGFQTIFAGYEETRAFIREIGIPDQDLRPFAREIVIWTGERWQRLRPDPRLVGRLGGVLPSDLAKLVSELARLRLAPREEPLSDSSETALAYLRDRRGYSEAMIDLLIRPLFSSITLDRELGSDAGYFRYLAGMLARGPAMIPSDGVGMIVDWAASSIRQSGGHIETGAQVQSLDLAPDGRTVVGVTAQGGKAIAARSVVLAVEPAAARQLLRDVDPAVSERLPERSGGTTSAAFLLDTPLYEGRTLLLNGAPDTGGRPRIDLICQTSNLTRPGGAGPHTVHAQSVTTGEVAPSADQMVSAVGAAMSQWVPGFNWSRHAQPIDVWHHPSAQHRVDPGVRDKVWGAVSSLPNLILAGDMMRHPSIEGAVGSGTAAAAAARDALDLNP